MALEEQYSGDSAWKSFVAVHRASPMSGYVFDPNDFQDMPAVPAMMRDVVDVAGSYFGMQGMRDWMDSKVVALEGETPSNCIFGEVSDGLLRRMREYLMRLPS